MAAVAHHSTPCSRNAHKVVYKHRRSLWPRLAGDSEVISERRVGVNEMKELWRERGLGWKVWEIGRHCGNYKVFCATAWCSSSHPETWTHPDKPPSPCRALLFPSCPFDWGCNLSSACCIRSAASIPSRTWPHQNYFFRFALLAFIRVIIWIFAFILIKDSIVHCFYWIVLYNLWMQTVAEPSSQLVKKTKNSLAHNPPMSVVNPSSYLQPPLI